MNSLNNFTLFFSSFFIFFQDVIGQQQLSMVDSMVVDAPGPTAFFRDIYYIDNSFKVRFGEFKNDTSAYNRDTSIVYIKDVKDLVEKFIYPGNLILGKESGLYKTKNGYMIPRYTHYLLTHLNTSSFLVKNDIILKKNFYYKSGFLGDIYYPGANNYFLRRNDGYYQDSILFYHCYKDLPYGARVNKLERYVKQQSKRIKENYLVMKYNLGSHKFDKPFGKYPAAFSDSFAYYRPNIINFSAYQEEAVYISYGGDPRIVKYDFN